MKKTLAIAMILLLSKPFWVAQSMVYAAAVAPTVPIAVSKPVSLVKVVKTGNDTPNFIIDKLKIALPDLKVDTVHQTEIPGIYEVASGHKVFYVDSTGQYAFLGNLVNLTTKRSVTQQKIESLSVVDWNKLPLTLAIRHVIGNGERKIAVFTDPDCPFCKELDQNTIPKLKNVTVYYFLFPLPMHANAKEHSQRILCSEMPEKIYLSWMTKDRPLPNKTVCEKAKTLLLIESIGKKVVGVEATPLIILPNGALVSGLVPPDYLNKLIDDVSLPMATNHNL